MARVLSKKELAERQRKRRQQQIKRLAPAVKKELAAKAKQKPPKRHVRPRGVDPGALSLADRMRQEEKLKLRRRKS